MRILHHSIILLRAGFVLLATTMAVQAQDGGPGGNGPGGGGGASGEGRGGGFGGAGNELGSGNGLAGQGGPQGRSGASSPDLSRYTRGPEGALEAVRAKQALPIDLIVGAARRLTDGEVIDARMVAAGNALQYDLKVLEATGDVRSFLFDARTGQLVRIR
ncbi:hypothetical protein [Aureimonas sp. ME7]|uniref:PepSY domain-containing protein n=1 Tax=Aureimonas sp. ME7 TaxID=2744252 RepID=UPI0015F63D2F|nr:hypothetical protein [Aureimonas sp. ME7]